MGGSRLSRKGWLEVPASAHLGKLVKELHAVGVVIVCMGKSARARVKSSNSTIGSGGGRDQGDAPHQQSRPRRPDWAAAP